MLMGSVFVFRVTEMNIKNNLQKCNESMIIEGKTRSLDTGVQAGTGSNESETLGTPAPASRLAVRATNFAAPHDHFIEYQLQ